MSRVETSLEARLAGIQERSGTSLDEAFRILEESDFDVSAKQTYVSLRREKRFATVGPVRETHVEVGLDVEGLAAGDRLRRDGLGGSRYSVRISDPEEVDDELLEWMRSAFESAGRAERLGG